MAQKVDITVEEKLRALYDLQLIDSKIDELQNTRGELPLEVSDLEDEVEGLKKRHVKFKEELDALQAGIAEKKAKIEEAKALIKKYSTQQKNVRNNREYTSISKEIEFQELEVQLAEKLLLFQFQLIPNLIQLFSVLSEHRVVPCVRLPA